MDCPPVDLSFLDLTSVTDAMAEEPHPSLRPLRRTPEGRYVSRALRLNNNQIKYLGNIALVQEHFLSSPSHLSWLDLSCNKLLHIEEVLCDMLELRVLYLHGNGIYDLSEVDKLGRLPHLHTITLHGNDMAAAAGYRLRVIAVLPNLKSMDFNGVTPDERHMAKIKFPGVKRH